MTRAECREYILALSLGACAVSLLCFACDRYEACALMAIGWAGFFDSVRRQK